MRTEWKNNCGGREVTEELQKEMNDEQKIIFGQSFQKKQKEKDAWSEAYIKGKEKQKQNYSDR